MNDGITLFVADGLGHGEDAAEASVEAVRLFHRFGGHQVPTLLDYIHGGLRSTRGAAVSDRPVRPENRAKSPSPVWATSAARSLRMRQPASAWCRCPEPPATSPARSRPSTIRSSADLIVLHSDGISTNWTLGSYPNLQIVHPTLIAAILYRDFGRRRDDATVLVDKWVA